MPVATVQGGARRGECQSWVSSTPAEPRTSRSWRVSYDGAGRVTGHLPSSAGSSGSSFPENRLLGSGRRGHRRSLRHGFQSRVGEESAGPMMGCPHAGACPRGRVHVGGGPRAGFRPGLGCTPLCPGLSKRPAHLEGARKTCLLEAELAPRPHTLSHAPWPVKQHLCHTQASRWLLLAGQGLAARAPVHSRRFVGPAPWRFVGPAPQRFVGPAPQRFVGPAPRRFVGPAPWRFVGPAPRAELPGGSSWR